MKKQLINEAFRLQQLAGIQPINSLNEKLDDVGREDSDVDNDGDEDESDEFILNRRELISKNMSEGEDHEVAMAQATISSAGILSSGAIIEPSGTDYYDLQVNPGTGSTIAAGEGFTFFEAFKLIGA